MRLISKFKMSQTGQQVTTIHIFPNISRIKGNQAIKFDKLTKYKMEHFFLEKSYRK